jgi:hypothetical protein
LGNNSGGYGALLMDEKLAPLYYLIGFLVISNLGSIISKLYDRSKDKDKDLTKLTETVIRLETKMEIFSKDLNNIGKKLRGG